MDHRYDKILGVNLFLLSYTIIFVSIVVIGVVSIPAYHAEDQGSIPRQRDFLFIGFFFKKIFVLFRSQQPSKKYSLDSSLGWSAYNLFTCLLMYVCMYVCNF